MREAVSESARRAKPERAQIVRALAIVLGAAALLAPSVARAAPPGAEAPLPESDYAIHSVCGSSAGGGTGGLSSGAQRSPGRPRARCLALRLVPLSAAARAHGHPLGVAYARPAARRATSANAARTAREGGFGLTPAQLHAAYALPVETEAVASQRIALIDAYNDPTAEADLRRYDEEFELPECTSANGCFTQVGQGGSASELPANEAGWAQEIALDIESAHAVCPRCKLLLVEAKSTSYEDLEAAEQTAIGLGATELSNSWGGPEPGSPGAVFSHPGVAILAAAGDAGYMNWQNATEEGEYVNYPAAAPGVIAVGGTRLTVGPSGEWLAERIWDGNGATGGGCAQAAFDSAPLWQSALSNWEAVGCGLRRAVSDIAADADPYTGFAVYDSTPYKKESGWLTFGGTSLATPLIAGALALAGGDPPGVNYPAQTIYANAEQHPASRHDVTEGSNGSCTKALSEGLFTCGQLEEASSCSGRLICQAASGYDGPSGVGSPKGLGLFAAITETNSTSSSSTTRTTTSSNNSTSITSTTTSSGGAPAIVETTSSSRSGGAGEEHAATPYLRWLGLLRSTRRALARHRRSFALALRQIAFAYRLSNPGNVRVALFGAAARGSVRWRQIGAGSTISSTSSFVRVRLAGRLRLNSGRYLIALNPPGSRQRNLYFRIR